MGQLLGFIYAFFLIISNYQTTTKQILTTQTISFFFKSIHYYILNGTSAFIISIISMIRNIIFYKIKTSTPLTLTFIIIYILIGYITYQNIISSFPVLATITYTIFINYNKPLYLKAGTLITSILWLSYNIYINSYSGIIIQILMIISSLYSIIKLDKKD